MEGNLNISRHSFMNISIYGIGIGLEKGIRWVIG